MPDKSNLPSNNCAYCLKPVSDNFICAECMVSKNVSLERLGVPSEEQIRINQQAARAIATAPSGRESCLEQVEDETALPRMKAGEKKWKRYPLNADFSKVGSKAKLMKWGMIVPVSVVGFGVSTMFGFPEVLASCIALALGVGWVIYRSEQTAWYHYASWVFKKGQRLECEVDLVSSGELDQPYIVLKDDNRISLIHETRVFKVVVGDAEKLLRDRHAPGTKSAFLAIATFDRELAENAVIFEINDCLLWCKSHLSRGI